MNHLPHQVISRQLEANGTFMGSGVVRSVAKAKDLVSALVQCQTGKDNSTWTCRSKEIQRFVLTSMTIVWG